MEEINEFSLTSYMQVIAGLYMCLLKRNWLKNLKNKSFVNDFPKPSPWFTSLMISVGAPTTSFTTHFPKNIKALAPPHFSPHLRPKTHHIHPLVFFKKNLRRKKAEDAATSRTWKKRRFGHPGRCSVCGDMCFFGTPQRLVIVLIVTLGIPATNYRVP